MLGPRLIGTAAATVVGAFGLFGAVGTANASVPPETSAPPTSPPTTAATVEASVNAVPCAIVDSDVEGGWATFTVGPDGCIGEVGPISFSTYALPSGQIMPYEDQVLIAHAEGNGSMYAAGTYTLTASVGTALNWQADLYFGMSDDQPPHPDMIDVDAMTGVVPATTEAPTTTSTTTTTTTTTAPQIVVTPNVVVNVSVPAAASAGPTVPIAPDENENATASAVAVVNESPQVAAQTATTTTTTTTPQTLPETGNGSSTPLLLTTGGALSAVGLAARRLARRH